MKKEGAIVMADKHPYISGSGAVVKCVEKFRNSLPPNINAKTLKKYGLAPKNESYLINILKFLNVVGNDDKPTGEAKITFNSHTDSAFEKKFSEMVQKAYGDLFSLHKDKAWDLDLDELIAYFRVTDQSAAVVGKRQANTFKTLAALSGHGEKPVPVKSSSQERKVESSSKKAKKKKASPNPKRPNQGEEQSNYNLGLAVRIEINLPVSDDQGTYDKIFKSIRKNLINNG